MLEFEYESRSSVAVTTKIRIPSSEAPPPLRAPDTRNPSGKLLSGFVALVLTTLAVVTVLSAARTSPPSEGEIPPAFPIDDLSNGDRATELPPAAPTLVKLRGAGTVLAVGSVGETLTALTTDAREVIVWRMVDGVWSYSGRIDVDSVDSAQVSDNRILFVGSVDGIPYVWEWLDGQIRILFQAPTGFITGAWSVGGQLVVATSDDSSSFTSPGDAVRFGRRDDLWLEGADGQFQRIETTNLTTVLTITGVNGVIAVGGSDKGRPVFGFVGENSVVAEVLPTEVEDAGVTDIVLDPPEAYALVSGFGADSSLLHTTIRAGARDWDVVADGEFVLGIASVAGRLVALEEDGVLVDVDAGFVAGVAPFSTMGGLASGLAVTDDEPIVFGEVDGQPAMAVWGPAALRVSMPGGLWQRYHSEASDGFQLIHVGTREFALRGTGLFLRPWNSDRWHRAEFEDDVSFFGQPRIVETEWGFVLAPLVGSAVYRSDDGSRWERVETPLGRIGHLVTDGSVVLAMSSVNSPVDVNRGPTTELAVISESGVAESGSIPLGTIAPGWAEGVGFYASAAPGPTIGFVTSENGLEWNHITDGARYDLVTAVDSKLYWWSGESAIEGGAALDLPDGAIGLVVRGRDMVIASAASGANWLWVDDGWTPIGFGVSDGLPGRPDDMIIRDGVVYAFVEAGVSREVWTFDTG